MLYIAKIKVANTTVMKKKKSKSFANVVKYTCLKRICCAIDVKKT